MSFKYPLIGVAHTASNPHWWLLFIIEVLPLATLIKVFVYPICFMVVYPCMVPLYAIFYGPFAILAAFASTLSLCLWIDFYLLTSRVMPKVEVKVYRQIWYDHYGDWPEQAVSPPLVTVESTAREIICFFLGFLPIVGIPLVVVVRARSRGQRPQFIWRQLDVQLAPEIPRRDQFLFGLSLLLLEAIPLLSVFFMYTNAIAGGSWAASYPTNATESTQPNPAATPPSLEEENFSRKRNPAFSLW